MGDAPFGCRAGRDGECNWERCPQERDGEPARTGRHCPRDILCGDPGCDATERANAALTTANLVILPRAVVMEAVEAMGDVVTATDSLIDGERMVPDVDRIDAARAKLMEAMRDE